MIDYAVDDDLNELNAMADKALLGGALEVYLDDRDKFMEMAHKARLITMKCITSDGGCHWFKFWGIKFKYRFRPKTDDDEYVDCLSAAGII